MARGRGDRPDLAQQPAEVVERMAEREQHTATEVRSRAVPLPIVLARMPVRQILTPMRMEAPDRADPLLLDHALDREQAGMETELESHEHLQHTGLDQRRQPVQPFLAVGHGLLDQQVRPRLCCEDRRLEMQRRRVRNDRRDRAMGQGRGEAALGPVALDRRSARGPLARPTEHHVRVPERAQIAEMPAADRPQADDQDAAHEWTVRFAALACSRGAGPGMAAGLPSALKSR